MPTETPAKEPLLTRREAMIAAAVAVIALGIAFVPLVDCTACGKNPETPQQNLESSRAKDGPRSATRMTEKAIRERTCPFCRGSGRVSLVDRVFHGDPLPPPDFK